MIRPITDCVCLGTGRVREVWSGGHSCDLAPAREDDRETFACPDCRRCDGDCGERYERDEMHEVDGDYYCSGCALALVRALTPCEAPLIRDTLPCGAGDAS